MEAPDAHPAELLTVKEAEFDVETKMTMWPFFFGVAVYCYEGVGMVIPLESEMKDPGRFPSLLVSVIGGVTLLYGSFGMFGYLAFGDDTREIITLNLPEGMLPVAMKSALCIGLYFTHPLCLYPVHQILEAGCYTARGCVARSQQNGLRLALVSVTALCAITIPNFGIFLSLIGSSCAALLALILPSAFHLKLRWHTTGPLSKARDAAVLLIGVAAGIVGTLDAGRNLLQHYHGHKHVAGAHGM